MISRHWAPIHLKATQVISQAASFKAIAPTDPFYVVDGNIEFDFDQQIRVPVKRCSDLHGDNTLNPKRMKRSTVSILGTR